MSPAFGFLQKGVRGPGSLLLSFYEQDERRFPTEAIDYHCAKTNTMVYAGTPYRSETLHCRNYAVAAGGKKEILLDLSASHGWYDFSVLVEGADAFEERFAGKVETGAIGKTDPLLGAI